MDKQKLAAILITACMGIFVATSVSGKNDMEDIGNSIADVQSSIDAQESMQKELEDELKRLEEYRNDLLQYMDELNKTYASIQDEIISLDRQILEKNNQVEAINLTLEQANIELDDQYEAMKARIRYMYETGDMDYITVFLTSGNISDALNQVEYISKIIDYDRNQMDRYREAVATVQVMKEELEKEQAELNRLRSEQLLKQDECRLLMEAAADNISGKEEEIEQAESAALKKEQEIAEMYEYLEYLEEMESSIIAASISESIRESIEASKAQEKGEEYTTRIENDYVFEDGDLEKLAALIHCEAGGEKYEGKLAVGTVVMNRIKGRYWPNNLEGVITQPYQFSPVSVSGRYYIVLKNKSYGSASVRAAQEIIDGVRTGNWCYFRTVKSAIATGKIEANPHGVIIGNHFFY